MMVRRLTILAAAAALGCGTTADVTPADVTAPDDAGSDAAAPKDTTAPPQDTPDVFMDVAPDTTDTTDVADSGPPPDPCAGNLLVSTAEEIAAIAHCTTVKMIEVNLCNGQADTVDLPALQKTEENFQFCVDAGDKLSVPALKESLVGWFTYADTDVTVMLDALAIELTLGIVSKKAGIEIQIPGVVSGGDIEVGGEMIAWEVHIPDLVTTGKIGPSDGTDTLVLNALESVAGNVAPSQQFFSFLEVPSLVSIGGDLYAGGGEFQKLVAPKLESIGGKLIAGGGPFSSNPQYPSLKSVGDELRITWAEECDGAPCSEFGTGPSEYAFPVLETVGGRLLVSGTVGLPALELPALTTAGEVEITDNTQLASLSLPALKTVDGDLTITGNLVLPQCLVDWVAAPIAAGGETALDTNLAGCTCEAGVATCPES